MGPTVVYKATQRVFKKGNKMKNITRFGFTFCEAIKRCYESCVDYTLKKD